MNRVDVFISGAGIAGLTLAARLAAGGLTVAVADPAPPPPDITAPGADTRSTAFLAPARALFEAAGLWDDLAPHAMPLDALAIVESRGDPPETVAERIFRAKDLLDGPFGWNLPNWLTRKTLVERLTGHPRVTLHLGAGFASLLARETEARIALTDGTRISARLAVAADGRASPLRAAAGIGVKTIRYGQAALAFAVTHDLPHENVSTEIYHSGGAFTLVPMPDREERPASAVVWMEDAGRAEHLASLSPENLGAAATHRSLSRLGALTPVSPAGRFPIVTQRATALSARRLVVLAEAAHVLPPIGAQGLNTSMADIAELARIALAAPGGIGEDEMCRAYARARGRDVALRAAAIDVFNRICRPGDRAISELRAAGLALVHDLAPLRHGLMRAGLPG